jgi:hypothetical protein
VRGLSGKKSKREENETKKAQKKKHRKDIDPGLFELNKKENQFEPSTNAVSDKIKEIRLTLELIKYLKAEVANKKEELSLLKKSFKESNQKG